MTFSSIRRSWYSRSISLCLMVTFVTSMVITPRAQAGVMGLPQPGTMVDLSPAYVPLMITGLSMHPENPLLMDFIVSTGNSGLNAQQVKEQSDRLIKYFLACLTIPENNQWVNLSPYEKQRIVPEDLGQTVLGQDMLAQDYILKQLTASLIYPERNLGKNFWDTVYAKARQMYGTTQIPVNTFNKVWILPEFAKVYEHNNTVFVVKSHLKVMLDEDYLALSKHAPSSVIASEAKQSQVNNLGSQIIRQIILPAIEKEVNAGKNFAQLRQIYNSMILAVWFKKNLKQALLNQVYTDKSKVNGVKVVDPAIKEKIYQQYLQAYKKGVFNYIKEEVNQTNQQTIPRKYFSGGIVAANADTLQKETPAEASVDISQIQENEPGNEVFDVSGLNVGISGSNQEVGPSSAAMTASEIARLLLDVLDGLNKVEKTKLKLKASGNLELRHDLEDLSLILNHPLDEREELIKTVDWDEWRGNFLGGRLAALEDLIKETFGEQFVMDLLKKITTNKILARLNQESEIEGATLAEAKKNFKSVIKQWLKEQPFAKEGADLTPAVNTTFQLFKLESVEGKPGFYKVTLSAAMIANLESLLSKSEGLVTRLEKSNQSGNLTGIAEALEDARVKLNGDPHNSPYLFAFRSAENPEEVDVTQLSIGDIQKSVAPYLSFTLSTQDAQLLKDGKPFSLEDASKNDTIEGKLANEARSNQIALIEEAALKAGLLGTRYYVTNIKRFSANSPLIYMDYLRGLAKEFNGHAVFLLSIEESDKVLLGDMAGEGTALAAVRKVLGDEFLDTANIDIITDGGLKSRAGGSTALNGYNGLFPSAYGIPYYRRAMQLLGKVRMQHQNFGKGKVYWTASDGDYQMGNMGYGKYFESDLENDDSWGMALHGVAEKVVEDSETENLFNEIEQAEQAGDWNNIQEHLVQYPLIAQAIKNINAKKLTELGENFADPQTGMSVAFVEKPSPVVILQMLKKFKTNSIIPNAFLVVYNQTAFKKQQDKLEEVDADTGRALREFGGSYFDFVIGNQYQESKSFKALKPAEQKQVAALWDILPKSKVIVANQGGIGAFTDRGKIEFLVHAYDEEIQASKIRGESGLIKRGIVKVGNNVTLNLPAGATAILENVVIEAEGDQNIVVDLADNTFFQNVVLRLNSNVKFGPDTVILNSKIEGKVELQPDNHDIVVEGVVYSPGTVQDFTQDGQWESPQSLQLYSGEMAVSVLKLDGTRYINRGITKANYKDEPLLTAFGGQANLDQAKALHPRLGLNLPIAKDWYNHPNWQGQGTQNVDVTAAKPFIDYVGMARSINDIKAEVNQSNVKNAAMSSPAAWQVGEKTTGTMRLLTVTREETQEEHTISLQSTENSVFATVDDGTARSFAKTLLNAPLQTMINTILDTVLGSNRAMQSKILNPELGYDQVREQVKNALRTAIKEHRGTMLLEMELKQFIASKSQPAVSGELERFVYEVLTDAIGLCNLYAELNETIHKAERETALSFVHSLNSNIFEIRGDDYDHRPTVGYWSIVKGQGKHYEPNAPWKAAGKEEPSETGVQLVRGTIKQAQASQAMSTLPEAEQLVSPNSPEGGIDLNSRNLNMESSGQKINITFNPAMIAQFERGDFSGVKIKILDVVPINLMPFLGLKENEVVG